MTSTSQDSSRPGRGLDGMYALGPDAFAILARHRPDPWGICLGCEEQFCLLVRYPCGHARWATRVDRRIPTPATLAVLGLSPAGPTQRA